MTIAKFSVSVPCPDASQMKMRLGDGRLDLIVFVQDRAGDLVQCGDRSLG